MRKILITNGNIVNCGTIFKSSIIIEDDKILKISEDIDASKYPDSEIIDATGKYILPGIIDTHVHFRQPGLETKADIFTETQAAVAGGITTFFDMPNTIPQTTTKKLLEKKFTIASENSIINYSFFIGATNKNIEELTKTDINNTAGIKLFYASSTGDMLVNKHKTVEEIFKNTTLPIAVHSEDQAIINESLKKISAKYNTLLPEHHEFIRSAESCYSATCKLIDIAKKYNTKLHLLHITTANELELFSKKNVDDKKITAEVSPNHLYFDSRHYKTLNMQIKCNPSIKSIFHKSALIEALKNGKIDSVASDHAPHAFTDKLLEYKKAPSGIPSIQHTLNIMLELVFQQKIKLPVLVEKMCHNPAKIFNISKRGFIKTGYYADLVIVDTKSKTTVKKDNILYKCGWSPLEGTKFNSKIIATFVNGKKVFENGKINTNNRGKRVIFDR